MDKKIVKKLLSILMIITILATDFYVLGSSLITYAAQQLNSETNNSNIQFSAYFKNDSGQKTDSLEKSIKSDDLKLYAEIKVKEEGFFKGAVEILNSNFNIKNNKVKANLENKIESIEGNKVNLKQINAGEKVEIELDIEPIISDKITTDLLSKVSTAKLTGVYTYSEAEAGENIQALKEICVNYQIDENAGAELDTDIVTNKIFAVNGVNKRIVQVLVKSRLTENQYPVKQTTLNVNIPKLSEKEPEEMDVLAIGTLATNGLKSIDTQNLKNENGVVEILIKNEPNSNNQINWKKGVYDELIVTFVYPEDVDASTVEVTTNSKLELYNSENTYTAESTKGIQNKELNNIIFTNSEINTTEIYKGQLYANITATEKKDVEYKTTTSLVITNKDVAETIELTEGKDSFGLEEDKELKANTKYISTEINKDKMLEILGQDGSITINAGTTTTKINKDTEVTDQNTGNIVVNYSDDATEISVLTTKTVKTGILELQHKKAIVANEYSRKQLETVKTLKVKSSVVAQNVVKNSTEASIELQETMTKANLTINKANLSTIMKNTDVVMGIELVTKGEKYDLYKNATIKIQLPSVVESVNHKVELINDDSKEFGVSSNYNNAEKAIYIYLNGEQKQYKTTQLYLQLELDIKLSRLAVTQTDKVTMTYSNANANKYFGETTEFGIVEKTIGISSPTGVVTMFNLASNANMSIEDDTTQEITSNDAGKELTFETIAVNNTDSDISNVKIFGKLPTTGVEGNTLETTLQSITATKGTMYFTENSNADDDTENAANGWTTDLSTLSNAKLYLIKLDTLAKGENYTAIVKVKLPNTLKAKTESYTNYEIRYNTITGNSVEVSRKIRLLTNVAQNVDVTLTAQVGQETLNTGDTVKQGEVIKYTATVKNNTNKTLQNIQLKAEVPEGTVVVIPMENYVYIANQYYQEKPNITDITETISTLSAGQTYVKEYEVRVKNDITTGTEISNQAIVIHDNVQTESFELKNKLQEADVRVTIKRANDEIGQLVPGGSADYSIIVENLSNNVLQNLELEVITDDMKVQSISYDENMFIGNNVPEKLTISEIPANGVINCELDVLINNDVTTSIISINVTNSNKVIHRSNTVIEQLPKIDATISLSSPQDNAYVNEGDIIEYNITIKNTGELEGYVAMTDFVSEYLEVQEVYVNGELTQQATINPPVIEAKTLDCGEDATIRIITKVGTISENDYGKVISNYAKVDFNGVEQEVTSEINHILKRADTTIEEIKNIVSGSVWFDKNQNGQKDINETNVENVIVKLYDIAKNGYLLNEKDTAVKTFTDKNGDYTFTKVPNGIYLAVFEYNSDKYIPTTYLVEGASATNSSKARLQNILVNGVMVKVTATESINIQDNVLNIDLGLIEKDNLLEDKTKNIISGYVWIDENKDGSKDIGETVVGGAKVKLLDNNGNTIETVTDIMGQYYFANIEKDTYKVVFEYDTEKYKPTTYLAQGVESARSSKATINKMIVNGQETIITSTDNIDVQDDLIDINLGLIEIDIPVEEPNNPDEPSKPEDSEDPTTPEDPEKPEDPTTPKDPEKPEDPITPENPDDPKEPSDTEDVSTPEKETKIITGLAWLDENVNGEKDADEVLLSGIKVKLYNVLTKNYLTNSEGSIIETTTDDSGKYAFNGIEKGSYIVIFEYDTEKYELTKYLAEGVDTTRNSKAVLKNIEINGQEVTATVTDIINLQENIFNINIGLKENLKFDLELNKYISRVVVQTNKNTKTYDYEDSNFEKIEIHKKQINGALVVIEYTIKVKNNGELAGSVPNIIDYLPNGLTFNSELNSDWYISEDNLHTKSLENIELKPGEEKELKLILTKKMTGDNIGWINNRAEIYQHYNKYGNVDIDSTPNNKVESEDDMGAADIIIGISTGGSIIGYIILLIINTLLIGIAINIMIKNGMIKISNKKGRR